MTTSPLPHDVEAQVCPVVVHIISHFDMGGAERIAASLAMDSQVDAHVVEIMRGRSAYTRSFINELQDAGVHVHRAWMPDIRWHFLFERLTALLFPLRFLFTCLRYRPQVLHVHTEGPDMCAVAFLTLFPYWRKRMRVVRTIHNTQLWTGQRRIGGWVERFYGRHAVGVAISQSVLGAYEAKWGHAHTIIYNGVGRTVQQPYPHLVPGKMNILFCGRLEAQKGVQTLIDVIRRVGADGSCPYHFHIHGDGSLRPLVEAGLAGLPCVSLRPPLHGMAAYLGAFDYLFMPSQFEGLSTLSIEASLASLPNIINDAPGLGETLPPDWPLKVQGNDVDDFVSLFSQVLPSADRKQLGQRAQAYAAEHFSLRAMQRAYIRLYRGDM